MAIFHIKGNSQNEGFSSNSTSVINHNSSKKLPIRRDDNHPGEKEKEKIKKKRGENKIKENDRGRFKDKKE